MKKIVLVLAAAFVALSAFAYNPPVQGENLFYLAHPEMITGGLSTAGGGLLSVTPTSATTLNPALGALERRITVELGYTAMFDSIGPDTYGQAFGTGILIPTDWATFSGEFEGVLVPFYNMHLNKSLNFRAAVSKQILDKLYVGVGVGGGYIWGAGKDWMLTADIGAVYCLGDLAFLKNVRIGASVNNLGKVYNPNDVIGIKGWANDGGWNGFPFFSTIRTGIAAELVDKENFRLGLSFDVTTPFFQNLIFDSGVQIEIMNFIKITSSWEYNYKEAKHNRNSWLPTVGVVFKFNIGTGFMKKADWSTSEISPSGAWKNVDGDINMFSAGAIIRVGELDTEGPSIEMD